MKKILLVLLIIVSLVLIACNTLLSNYMYEITGTATSVRITFYDENGSTIQQPVNLPWSYSFQRSNGYDFFAYLSAQNEGTDGTVTAKIYKEGNVERQATASGAYCSVTINYSWSVPKNDDKEES